MSHTLPWAAISILMLSASASLCLRSQESPTAEYTDESGQIDKASTRWILVRQVGLR